MRIERLIARMVGRTIDQLYPSGAEPVLPRSTALAVRGVSQPGIVRDISFDLHRGEVLGVSGLMGCGPFGTGADSVRPRSVRRARSAVDEASGLPPRPRRPCTEGMAFLTEDRRVEGLMMEAPIAANMALASLPDYAPSWPSIDQAGWQPKSRRPQRRCTCGQGETDADAVRNFSGGNQQKVVIGKWLLRRPSIFILDEPTRGIDVGAKYEVYKIIARWLPRERRCC